jgi:hypothetical protein
LRAGRSLGTVTSLDDDGSTRRDPQAGEAASRQAGLPHDDDGVRLSAPADPWLTEAPTSAISDATTLRDFNAAPDAAPPTATTPSPGLPPTATTPLPDFPPAGAGPEPVKWADGIRHHDGRRRRLVVAVLAACAVFVAGLLAVDQFGSGNDPESTSPAPSTATTSPTAAVVRPAADRPKSPAATTSKPMTTSATAPEVVYEVTASGSKNTGSVSYTDEDGDIIRRNGIPLPWRVTFPLDGQRKPLVLDAQRTSGGDNGPVTCTITVNGKVLASTTADGRYAATLCSGSA